MVAIEELIEATWDEMLAWKDWMAARMADEAREIEKKGDAVLREPHFKDGSRGRKRALIEKPKRD